MSKKKQTVVKLSEGNKVLVGALNEKIEELQGQAISLQTNLNIVLGQRQAILNAVINEKGYTNKRFNLTPELDLVEEAEEAESKE